MAKEVKNLHTEEEWAGWKSWRMAWKVSYFSDYFMSHNRRVY